MRIRISPLACYAWIVSYPTILASNASITHIKTPIWLKYIYITIITLFLP